MIKSGTFPTFTDKRDYDFARNFGAVVSFPDNFNVDSGKSMPDQEADQNPYECTSYTTNDIALDEDNRSYAYGYLYAKALNMAGYPPTQQGMDIREALKASRVYGLLPLDKTPDDLADSGESYNSDYRHWPAELDVEAAYHRRGKYFNVQPLNGDWFDGIRSAIQVNNRSVSVGTPWYPSWNNIGNDGIVSTMPNGTPTSWHNWKIAGWKTINGVPYLLGKTWQGKDYGDNGWAYFPREVINAVWCIQGTQAFTFGKATSDDLLTIKVDILQTVLAFCYRLLFKLTG